MLEEILNSCNYVVKNSNHVTIDYLAIEKLIEELERFNNVHYLTNVPFGIMEMSSKNIIDFLLIYDAIDFSFWGTPKWTVDTPNGELDGGIALLYCIIKLFKENESQEVYKNLSTMSFEEFSQILKGNIDIPLLKERYEIIKNISSKVVLQMKGSFYEFIKGINNDNKLFEIILSNFQSFEDTRVFNNEKIYFYKLAQLLTSDILHMLELKENIAVDYSNLIGCADYKIPQVMRAFGILNYSEELAQIVDSGTQILENDPKEIEIRAAMIVVINYIYEKMNKTIARIDINDFVWGKGKDKSKTYKPYHLTRTTTY